MLIHAVVSAVFDWARLHQVPSDARHGRAEAETASRDGKQDENTSELYPGNAHH